MRIWLDFETYSEVNLNDVGAMVYSLHPSTRVLTLGWEVSAGAFGTWVSEVIPANHVPPQRLLNKSALDQLFSYIEDRSNTAEAHNAFFERCIWENICVARMYWPEILAHQWRCSAAKAAACALPRNLEDAGRALRLDVVKDMTGNQVAKRLSKPLRVTKKVTAIPAADWQTLYEYNRQDIRSERALDEALPELEDFELEVWRADQAMNRRGIPCDVEGAKCAVALADEWTEKLNAELAQLTNGQADKATQRARILTWLQLNGAQIDNTQAGTLDEFLLSPADVELDPMADGTVRRVVEIVRSIGRSSVAKYQTLVDTAINGRLHDTQIFHGATTGRWTARRFQPHNLVRGKIKDMAAAWRDIHTSDLEWVQICHGDPMEFLSHSLRGAIMASAGKLLYSADYSAVETCVLFWLCGEEIGLDILRNPKPGEDIYTHEACDIYGRHITKADDEERQIGKRSVLGLGFGMGYIKFLVTCRSFGVTFTIAKILEIVPREKLSAIADDIYKNDWGRCAAAGMTMQDLPELALMKFIVTRYRARYAETVCQLWRNMERAAKVAVQNPGKHYRVGHLVWSYDGKTFLTCLLPSGRSLYYPFPALDEDGLTFMGVDALTHQWARERTYGGKLTENAVQAVARDVAAAALVRCERSGVYEPLFLVHDDMICQSDRGNVKEYAALISEVPQWAPGLPLKAGAWSGERYKKDA